MRVKFLFVISVLFAAGCADPYPGPDKQGGGMLEGAAVGAGTGAVTGFQVGAGTGPGAAVGAGVGAIAGGISGMVKDQEEEDLLALSSATRRERERAYVHEILRDHYKKRLELHPTRDIYPADLFFEGDDVKLRNSAVPIVRELAYSTRHRLPWSRMVIAAYVKASDKKSEYAQHLAEKRSRAIFDEFVRLGIEPRRLQARAVIIDAPILIDPDDNPGRYNQAIELIPVDR